MRNKTGYVLVSLFIFLMSFYLAYDASFDMTSCDEFFNTYFNVAQKYLYTISIYMIPILYLSKTPFLQPEYFVRLRGKFFIYLFKRTVLVSLIVSGYIFNVYLLSAILFGLKFTFGLIYAILFIRLFSFIFACVVLYYVYYYLSSKVVLSILSMFATNLLFLGILYGFNYYILINTGSRAMDMLIFTIYKFVIIVSGTAYLGINLERKECLN